MRYRVLALIVLVLIVALLIFYAVSDGSGDLINEEDTGMTLVTRDEFIEYLEENGLTEAFDDIDLDFYIKEYSIISDMFEDEIYRPENFLQFYTKDKAHQQRFEIMAKEIVNVESTDEEYGAFVDAFIEAVGEEFYFLGTYEDDYFRGLNGYTIVMGNERHGIYIGRTKNIDEYKIEPDRTHGERYGVLQISLPFGDMYMTTNYCYSYDNKFLLIQVPTGNLSKEFEYELNQTFTEVTY